MATYIVDYDLGKPGRDYDGLSKYLEAFPTHWHFLDSTWIVVTDSTAEGLRAGAASYLDNTYPLFVAKVSAPGAWQCFSDAGDRWLQSHL